MKAPDIDSAVLGAVPTLPPRDGDGADDSIAIPEAIDPPVRDTEPPKDQSTIPSAPGLPRFSRRADGLLEPDALEEAIGSILFELTKHREDLVAFGRVLDEVHRNVGLIRESQQHRVDGDNERLAEIKRIRSDMAALPCQPKPCPVRGTGTNGMG